MLKNDFYKQIAISENETGWNFTIELNPDHQIYQGHFPQQAIVPGVCLLQIIRECAEEVLQHKTHISQISSCKYLAVVDPHKNSKLEIHLSLKELQASEYILQASGQFAETDFIKLKSNLILA